MRERAAGGIFPPPLAGRADAECPAEGGRAVGFLPAVLEFPGTERVVAQLVGAARGDDEPRGTARPSRRRRKVTPPAEPGVGVTGATDSTPHTAEEAEDPGVDRDATPVVGDVAEPPEGAFASARGLIREPGFNSWTALRRRMERLRNDPGREPRRYRLPLDGYEPLEIAEVQGLDLPTLLYRFEKLQGGLQETEDLTATLTARRQQAVEEYRRLGDRAESLNRTALEEQQQRMRAQRAHLAATAAVRRTTEGQQVAEKPAVVGETAENVTSAIPAPAPSTEAVPPSPTVAQLIQSTAEMQKKITELTSLMQRTRRIGGAEMGPPTHAQMAHPRVFRPPIAPTPSRESPPPEATPTTSEEVTAPDSSVGE